MADYAVVFARSARKELQNLDPQVARRIIKQIEGLVTDPRPSGVVKLGGPQTFGASVLVSGELFTGSQIATAW